MTGIREEMERYLAIRRRLGFALARHGVVLADFVSYLEGSGIGHITVESAMSWATLPVNAHPAEARQRLGVVRSFARHLKTVDPATEVPPQDLLRAHRDRVTPYLYSDVDIADLLGAARALKPGWRAATYETLIGLQAVTGARLGEILGLDGVDVDADAGLMVLRRTKRGEPREVHLHATTIEALARYCQIRDERWPNPATPSLFVSARGQRLGVGTVHDNFRHLVDQAGLQGRGERCRPRPHDLRHTFAVRTLLDWYQSGADVEANLPRLSTHLGHVDPTATYWYLQASPELFAVVAQRLDAYLGARS